MSSANSYVFEVKLSDKLFIYIKKVAVPQLNPEEPLLQHLPMLNVDYSELLFVSYHLEN